MFYLSKDWQLLVGGEYQQYGDFLTRAGFAAGAAYNFGAIDHNRKYFIKPQFNYIMAETYNSSSEDGIFVTTVFGRRFPLFSGRYTINYTPSIGVSVPITNTDTYDTLFLVSLIGLSLVFD